MSPEPDVRSPSARLDQILDHGSRQQLLEPGNSRVAVVQGRVNGIDAIVYCTDGSRMGGALGAREAWHIVEGIEEAVRRGCPVLGIWHSGGAALAEGVESMHGVGAMFAAMTRASGVIPQISVVVGPAAGAAAYGPALTDIVIMSRSGRMFVTGPDVVRSVTGEQIDMEALGGIEAHGPRSGVAHVLVEAEAEAFERARHLVDLLGRQADVDLSLAPPGPDLRALHLPERANRAYDVRPLVRGILDDDCVFEELQPQWAANIVVGLGRLAGRTVGVIANNPLRKGGCLDSLSAEKAARFVRMSDAFGVPLVVLVDVPGYLPGVDQEWSGVIRRGAKLLHAFSEAAVPRATLVTRKAYGGAYIAMNSRSLGATAVFAWPGAEVAVMGADAAVGILHRKTLAAAQDEDREPLRRRLVAEHEHVAGGVVRAMDIGVVDEVIDAEKTRYRLAQALATAPTRRGAHRNIPL